MAWDASSITNMQQPDFSNAITSGVKMADMMNENKLHSLQVQQQTQQWNDQQAVRSAQDKNTTVDPDTGNTNINMKQMASDLVDSGHAHLVPQMQIQQREQKLQAFNQQQGFLGQLSGYPHDQASLDKAHQIAQNMGYDTSQFPTKWDDITAQLLKSYQASTLSAQDQVANIAAQHGLDIRNKEADVKLQEFGHTLKKDQNQVVQETQQQLQSARGNPAVQTAEQNIFSDAKVNKLVAQGVDKNGNFDPNKLNNTQVQLLAGEVAKIATGGAPTLDELKGLTPKNVPQIISGAAERYRNSPTPANAGDFVKQLQNYSNGVADDAKDLVAKNYQGIIESKKPFLPPGSYKTLNDQYIGRLNGTTPPSEWSLGQPAQPSKKSNSTQNQSSIHPALVGQTPEQLKAGLAKLQAQQQANK